MLFTIEATKLSFAQGSDTVNLGFKDIDAGAGNILIDDGKEAPKAPPKMWDLYGEKSE